MDRLFDRFKLDKYLEKYEKEEIDLQDFVIGLALLSRISFLEKVKSSTLFTQLSSIWLTSMKVLLAPNRRLPQSWRNLKYDRAHWEDILQGEFLRKGGQVPFLAVSYSLLFELAHKKATRNYNEILVLLKKNNK